MPENDVAAFLRSLPEFGQIPERALQRLAGLCEVWAFREGDLVRFADAAPDARLWVGEGCLAASRPEQPPRYIGVREEADVPTGYWLRGQTAGWYLRLPIEAWNSWRPAGISSDSVFRQSAALPAARCAVPAAFVALFAALGAVLSGLGTQAPAWVLWLLPGTGMLVAALWASLIVLEWRRSFVALAGRRLEIRRLDLGAREAMFETLAADRVRRAQLTRKGFWGLLGLVELEIETDVPGDGPGARFRFPGLPAGTPLAASLGGSPEERPATTPQDWAAKAGRAPTLVRGAVSESEAWFRRHWWFLAGRLLPWLGWCLLAVFVAAWVAGLWPAGASWCAVLGAAAAAVPLGRAVWEAWDWANDKFGVTAGTVVLLRRRPLWFGETRYEAPLDQVEQLGVLRSGLPSLVLDFGTVTVRLGPAEPLTFEGLSKPEAVRQAVLAKRTAVFAARDRQAAAQRFDEVADIIRTWDEGKKLGYWDGAKP